MPTLKKYQNEPGYYIRASVEQSVITYQTTPGARRLFNRLGYGHGNSIPWKMISQLSERGDIYILLINLLHLRILRMILHSLVNKRIYITVIYRAVSLAKVEPLIFIQLSGN